MGLERLVEWGLARTYARGRGPDEAKTYSWRSSLLGAVIVERANIGQPARGFRGRSVFIQEKPEYRRPETANPS